MRFRFKALAAIGLSMLASAAAHAQAQFQFPMAPWNAFAPGVVQCGWIYGANMNSTADQPITISVPSATYTIDKIIVSNPSVSLTTAAGGVYSAASKGGVAIVGSGQAYSALTTNAANTTGNSLALTIATAGNTTAFGGPSQGANAVTTIYLSLSVAQGAAATADVRISCKPLY